MTLQRRHYTVLAEVIGSIEAGRIPAGDVRQVIIDDLLTGEPNFKRDKFDAHADKQRDAIEREPAHLLREGESFEYKGLTLRADKITQEPDGVLVHVYLDSEHTVGIDGLPAGVLIMLAFPQNYRI